MSTYHKISGNYKLETRKTYEENFSYFARKFEDNAKKLNYLSTIVDRFLSMIPRSSLILDLGSGTGIYPSIFKERGHHTICIDNSESMVRSCIERGLDARVMDFENIDLL